MAKRVPEVQTEEELWLDDVLTKLRAYCAARVEQEYTIPARKAIAVEAKKRRLRLYNELMKEYGYRIRDAFKGGDTFELEIESSLPEIEAGS